MKNYRNTLQILVFVCILFPFWIADICFIVYATFMALGFVSIELPDTLARFLAYFAAAYIPGSVILILIGLIFDLIIAIHNKKTRKTRQIANKKCS